MRTRLLLLLKIFAATVAIFAVQKPLFMLFHSAAHPEVAWRDYCEVVLHALPLDLTMAGYLAVVPWLVILASWFISPRDHRRNVLWPSLQTYLVAISVVMAVVFVADTALYSFWGFKLDATAMAYIDKPAGVVASVSGWYVAACVAAVAVCAALYVALFVHLLPKERLSLPRVKWTALAMLPVAGLLFVTIRGGVGRGTANVSSAYYCENQFLNHSAVNPIFNLMYSLMHQHDFANECRFMDDERCHSIADSIYGAADDDSLADTLLSVRRPNVLLVVWEGCGSEMVESMGGFAGVTPNLERMADNGVMFTNCHANSFRTDRGLLSILSGWLSLPSISLMKVPSKCNRLPGLARSLREAGYTTDFWYGGDIGFANMGGFMLANGFQRTHSDRDFDNAYGGSSSWGADDGVVFDAITDELLARPDGDGQRWFTAVMTLSSHEPWAVPYSALADERQNAFAYTDLCLGRMFDRLKASPQWRNLLIVVVSDHGVRAMEGDLYSTPRVMRVPVVLTGGAVAGREGRKVDVLMNQSDLPATLLAQMGLRHDGFAMSRNVLGRAYVYPTAVNMSAQIVTFIDSTGQTTYDGAGDKVTAGMGDGLDDTRMEKGLAVLQWLHDLTAEL